MNRPAECIDLGHPRRGYCAAAIFPCTCGNAAALLTWRGGNAENSCAVRRCNCGRLCVLGCCWGHGILATFHSELLLGETIPTAPSRPAMLTFRTGRIILSSGRNERDHGLEVQKILGMFISAAGIISNHRGLVFNCITSWHNPRPPYFWRQGLIKWTTARNTCIV